MPLTKEQQLGEIEDLIRTTPSIGELRKSSEEGVQWLGRLEAVIQQWDQFQIPMLAMTQSGLYGNDSAANNAFAAVRKLLFRAQHDLRMSTLGPINIAVGQGQVFDYFDELRKIIEQAKQEIFFIDPYLDAEFVTRYLPYIAQDVSIRLLTTANALPKLLPAVEAFTKQYKHTIAIRTSEGMHDRYVFIERTACYQSGASFKDGARKAPTIITQITDAFSSMLQTYEDKWSAAQTVR